MGAKITSRRKPGEQGRSRKPIGVNAMYQRLGKNFLQRILSQQIIVSEPKIFQFIGNFAT
jgi:hypothetical protein